jgi:LuxR family maltose regulon positive regulatory protein
LLRAVFEQLPGESQSLLLTLGVAQQLCGDLASTLTSRQDGHQLLEYLETQQLFLMPLDHERRWYRFHNLFAEFLRAHLRSIDPERFKQLNANACLWFTHHHQQNLAIEHATQAEDPHRLAALINDCVLDLINRGQLHLIYKWRKRVPDGIAEDYPLLVLIDAWRHATDMGLSEAKDTLDTRLDKWRENTDQAPLSDTILAILTIQSVLAMQMDDPSSCIALARRIEPQVGQYNAFLEVAILVLAALANISLANPQQVRHLLALAQQRNHFLDGHYLGMQLANVHIMLHLEQGRIRQAQLEHRHLLSRVRPWFGERARALALPSISECLIAYRQGRLDGIEEQLKWALATVDIINPIDLYAQGMLCLACCQAQNGRSREAQASLRLMQNLAVRHHSWRFYALSLSEEISQILKQPDAERLYRAEQRYNSAAWARLAEHYQYQRFNPVLWLQSLTRTRLFLAQAHYSEALREISQGRLLLIHDWHAEQLLRLDLLAVLCHRHLGYRERARSLLIQCLIHAEQEDIRSLFVEEGEAMHHILLEFEATEREPAQQPFVRSILALWDDQSHRPAPLLEEGGLTGREREILQLAALGLSNEAIGQRLELALGTVKWHLHNIYEKLKVRNRAQAIRRANEMCLLA